MADTFTWGIANLERQLSDGAVTTVHWTLTAERTVGSETLTAGSYGSLGLDPADPNDFIAYDDLTSAEVIGWVETKLGADAVTAMETGLSGQLDTQENPTTGSGVPW